MELIGGSALSETSPVLGCSDKGSNSRRVSLEEKSGVCVSNAGACVKRSSGGVRERNVLPVLADTGVRGVIPPAKSASKSSVLRVCVGKLLS